MTAMFTKVALASVLATSALAQSSYTTGLLDVLRDNGLTTLAMAIASFNSSAFETAISTGNHTFFAPDNDALASVTVSTISNTTMVEQLFAYHFLSGSINTTSTSPDKLTIARTTLTGAPVVNLPGNQPQAIVLSETVEGNLTVVDVASRKNITSRASFKYKNLEIEVIPTVLTIPQKLSVTVEAIDELSTLNATIRSADPNLLPELAQTKGLTVFAPVNSAFAASSGELGSVAPADIGKILLNHLINGTVFYSPQITNSTKVTTAGGSTLTFATNSTGVFVTAGNSTARIIATDILVSNGVVHLIDSILLDTTSNPAAASSAVNSATSAEATQTAVETGPITATTTEGASATSSSTGGAYRVPGIAGSVVALAVVGLGALLA